MLGLLLVSLLVVCGLLWLPALLTPSLSDGASSGLLLMQSYSLWLKMLAVGIVVNYVALIAGCLFCLYKIISGRLVNVGLPVFAAIMIIGFMGFLNYFMVADEGVFESVPLMAEDVAQLQAGQEPVVKTLTVTTAEGKGWQYLLLPLAMDFEPEGTWNDNLSIPANLEVAQCYRIAFSSNFGMITSIEKIE